MQNALAAQGVHPTDSRTVSPAQVLLSVLALMADAAPAPAAIAAATAAGAATAEEDCLQDRLQLPASILLVDFHSPAVPLPFSLLEVVPRMTFIQLTSQAAVSCMISGWTRAALRWTICRAVSMPQK